MCKKILILFVILLLPWAVFSEQSQEIKDFLSSIENHDSQTRLSEINNKISETKVRDDLATLYAVRANIYENNNDLASCMRDLNKAVSIVEDPYKKVGLSERIEAEPIHYKYKHVTLENYKAVLAENKDENNVGAILLTPMYEKGLGDFDFAKELFNLYRKSVKTPDTVGDKLFGLMYMRRCENRSGKNIINDDFQSVQDFLDAIEYYDSTDNLVKDTVSYKYIKLEIYYNSDLKDDAFDLLKEMEEENILDIEGYLSLGSIYRDKGNSAKAKEYYKKGIESAENPAVYRSISKFEIDRKLEACKRNLDALEAEDAIKNSKSDSQGDPKKKS